MSIHLPFLYPPIISYKFQSKSQCTLLACFEKDGMVYLLWDCHFLNSKGKKATYVTKWYGSAHLFPLAQL